MKMQVSPDIHREYALMRDRARLELEHRKETVHGRIPRIAEIDRQMSQVGMDIARWVLRHPEDHQKGAAEIRATLDALKKERAELLASQGLDDRFLEMQFRCPHCSDTGYTPEGHPCRCLRQKLIDRAYQSSNLGMVLKEQHFGTFRLELFSDKPFPGKTLSPRENMRQISGLAQHFITHFEQGSEKSLIFHGDTGLGKTFLCSCIARSLLDKGYTVLYLTAFRVAEVMENYRFNRKDSPDYETQYRMIYGCDLLIIDDLGTEMTNTFTNIEFFNILNARLMSQRKMIFSTNLSPTELVRRYGERVSSRLVSQFNGLEFYGADLR